MSAPNTPSLGCRVCLKNESTTNAQLFPITTSWTPTNTKETIKDKLLFCVPSLTLGDQNKICQNCLYQLKVTCGFINKCLHTEISFNSSSKNVVSQNVAEDKHIEVVFEDSPSFHSNSVDITKNCFQDCDDSQQYLLEDLSSPNHNETGKNVKKDSSTKIPPDLYAALDYAPHKFSFISATMDEISSQQSVDTLNKMGINTIDMSTKSTGKKRIIYLARDYVAVDYDCPLCDAKCTSSFDVMDHTRLHHQKRVVSAEGPSFACDCCYLKFSEEEALKVHGLTAHNVKCDRSCKRCKKTFKSLSNLLSHEKMFKEFDKCAFKCPNNCTKEFFTKSSLEAHLKDVADAPCCNYVLCKVCSVKFTKEHFKEHSKIHPSYLCSHCGKSFAFSSNLSTHMSLVHKSSSTMCHECGKVLKNLMGLKNHIKTAHNTNRDALTFICDQCPKTFRSKQRLRHHIAMRHTDQPPSKVTCTICQKSYFSKGQLREHMKLIHEPPKKFECKLCGCKFPRKDYLNRHLNRHEVYAQFTCSICKICFASASRLSVHEKLGHDENGKALNYGRGGRGNTIKGPKLKRSSYNQKSYNKPCICKICHKVVANINSLRTHYKIHLRIREKKCEKCGLVMANAGSYNNHKKLHEDPNFDKRCTICYITKSSKLELLEHMKTVHKHLKHECKYCGKRFGRKYLLYSHESLEHQEATERKKEAFDMIHKEPVYLPDGLVMIPKSRKGIKLADYHSTDVDELITKISQGETAIQNSSDVCLDSFNILSEEYELKERVCTELIENGEMFS